MTPELITNILPLAQRPLLARLEPVEWLTPFYLAGGTALALQLGHRQSADFDFFSEKEFDSRLLAGRLLQLGRLKRLNEAAGTLHCELAGVKLSFFYYPHPAWQCIASGKLRIASILDIALMKLEAISGRGDKKDFIDLYFILRHITLPELLQKHQEKYGIDWSNRYHLLRSLAYFADADDQPMPLMLMDATWERVKETISRSVLELDPGEA